MLVWDRFIPAHAGNTKVRTRGNGTNAVHPRTRGEHITFSTQNVPSTGSSPHTRGTQRMPGRARTPDRFIPAHAGNTRTRRDVRAGRPVHPRTRGEHLPQISQIVTVFGSSPHTRGTLVAYVPDGWDMRFIPAHAGNTLSRRGLEHISTVHPRTRGEHFSTDDFTATKDGSSPHTRGTHMKTLRERQNIRFIPAHAGNTCNPSKPLVNSTVHPRTRGEHSGNSPTRQSGRGSSPHTRGTPVAAV